jgi:D-sedoheptulose 7-phosphate isomerase
LVVDSPLSATVQELHLVALHMVCEAMDAQLLRRDHQAVEVAS